MAAYDLELYSALCASCAELPARPTRLPRLPKPAASVTNVFVAFQEKCAVEFGFWVRTLDNPTVIAGIKTYGFDPATASSAG